MPYRFMFVLFTIAWGGTASAENLLKNAGFEDAASHEHDAQHWKMHEPDDHGDSWGTAIRADWRAREGRYIGVIRAAWSGVGEYGGFWQEVAGTGGTTYRAAAWFWADGVWRSETQEMKLEFWDAERTRVLGSETVALNDIGEIWVQKEVEALAPEGTGWVRLVINASGTGEGGALQIDEVSLVTRP